MPNPDRSAISRKAVARGKKLEREIASELKHLGARRIWRMGHYGISAPDVVFDGDLSYLSIDAKKYARMAHHTIFNEAACKYGGEDKEVAIVSQEKGKSQKLVVIDFEFFKRLIEKSRP